MGRMVTAPGHEDAPRRSPEQGPRRRRRRYTDILLDVSHALAGLEDSAAILELLHRTVAETLGCDRSTTVLLDEDDTLRLAARYGVPDDDVALYGTPEMREACRPLVDWLRREKRCFMYDGPPGPDALHPLVVETFHVRSLLIAPLLDGDRLLGGFTANWTRKRHRFTDAELSFVEALASHAATALHRARMRAERADEMEALRQSEERYRLLVDHVHAVIFTLGIDGRFEYLSAQIEETLGYRPAELCGKHFASILTPESARKARRRFREGITNRVPTHHAVYEAVRKDGSITKLEIHVRNLMGPQGVIGRHGIAHDVTKQSRLLRDAEAERRRTRRALARERRERARAQTLLQVVMAAASTLSVKKILIQVCDAVARLSVADRCSIFLYDDRAGALHPYMSLGINDPALWEKFVGAAGTPLHDVHAFAEALRTRMPFIETRVPGSNVVPPFWAETFALKSLAIYPMIVRDRVVGMMAVDSPYRFVRFPREEVETLAVIARQAAIIIDNARLFERVEQEARTDFLTGLPNHRYLQDLFESTLQEARDSERPFAIALVDMDNFKLLNDVHGHQAGDEVLRHAAAVMRRAVRPGDTVGRYGGDEFLFFFPGAAAADAERIMERVDEAIQAGEVTVPGVDHPIPLRISWGVAAYPEDGATRRSLIALADAALMERRFHRRALDPGSTPGLSTRDLMELHPETVLLAEGLLKIIDRKDPYTSEHSRQHASLCLVLADELGLPERERYALWVGGLLHDVGKIGVPAEILRKPGPLTAAEWETMRQHVTMSENIVRGLFDLEEAARAVATHHERFDGFGYPHGLRGEEIPLLGRMLAVVDAYSAMVHDRPYRKGLTEEAALEELRRNAGTQFDATLVDAFVAALGRQAERAA